MTTSRRFENQLFEYFGSLQQFFRGQPIILGGVSGPSGGGGGPPGGFIGYLPQTRVSYDTTEAATDFTPVSGMSLLDNLNHIRYSIQQISASGGATVLDDLTDVNTTGKSDGQVLTWDNDTSQWVASGVAPGGGATVIDDLTDVDTTGKDSGEVLTWNGSLWVPSGIAAVPSGGVVNLDDLQDVDTSGKTDGQVLTWDNDTSLWVASGISPGGGATIIDDLTDVDTTGKDQGEVLTWNGTLWVPSGISAVPSGGVVNLDDLQDVDTVGKTDGQVLTWDNDTSLWVASGISQTASSGPVVVKNQLIFTIDGLVNGEVVGVLPLRLYAHDIVGTIDEILCAVNTAPVSSGVRIDVLKNGSSILGAPNYIEIPVGSGYSDSNNITTSGFVKNDYFQLEVVREDSDASDLSVHIRYYWES